MRIFETFVVALLVVLMFTFVLNKKLDAGDKETAKLEEKLETAFKAMEWLRTDLAAARKQLKQHTAQLEQLKERDKKLVAGLKEGNKTLLATLKKRDKELVADLDDLHKYDKELAAWLKKRDKELASRPGQDWDKRTLRRTSRRSMISCSGFRTTFGRRTSGLVGNLRARRIWHSMRVRTLLQNCAPT